MRRTVRIVEVAEHDVEDVDFAFPSVATISGLVLCRDGRPCANIRVEAHPGDDWSIASALARSDERGFERPLLATDKERRVDNPNGEFVVDGLAAARTGSSRR